MPSTAHSKDHQRTFATLPAKERRAIVRAVNRGAAVADRRHAAFGVAVARRQQRFWRYAWLLGPFLGVIQLAFVELAVVLGNTGVTTLALGLMSWFWSRRAKRAERLNRELMGTRAPKRIGHVPGSRGPGGGETPDPAAGAGAPRPPRPRGRKRR